MQRLTASLIIVLFLIWILPLGFFIKPSQEKFACGGRRAICMCSHKSVNQAGKRKAWGMVIMQNNADSEREPTNSSGNGGHHYFIAALTVNRNVLPAFVFNATEFLVYCNKHIKDIEHVPKILVS